MRQRCGRFGILFFLGVACLLSSGLRAQEATDTEMAGALVHAKALSRAFRQAAEKTRPTVVTVLVKSKMDVPPSALRELLLDPRLRALIPDGLDPEALERGEVPPIPGLNQQVGSGVVVDTSGIILTNNHVVEDAESILVRLPDGREYAGEGLVTDPMSDLAIFRIAPQPDQPLTAAQFGDSDEMNIGDWVIAIGSPFELETTVSAGIISAKGRGIEQIKRGRLLQTDAAINPGNSGGPLVNLDGEVVGINTAIATSNGGYQGVGFAIPANRAAWIWRELLEHGRVRRAFLGIGIDELSATEAARFGTAARSGVWVRRVSPDGAAQRAGLQNDDVILEFSGVPVRMPRDLQDVVEQSPIGSKHPVVVLRGGEKVELEVTLESLE